MTSRRLLHVLFVAAIMLPSGATAQQPQPEGDQYRVSTTSNSDFGPSVAMTPLADTTLVAWHQLSFNPLDNAGIYGRLYSGASPLGTEFLINTTTSSVEQRPSVAASGADDFVVVWEDYASVAPYGMEIRGQRLDGTGGFIGPQFQANTYTTGLQQYPSVAADGASNFVVVWESPQDGSVRGVYAQRYDNVGSPLGTEFRVNSYTTNFQQSAVVAADTAGNFLIAWEGYGAGDSDLGVFAQRYNGAGSPQGTEFRINTTTVGQQGGPALTADSSGNYIVVWNGTDADGAGVFGQRYDGTGTSLGTEFLVNADTTGNQIDPSVTVDATGNFTVVWSEIPGSDLFGRYFDAAGNAVGGDFPVSTSAFGTNDRPQVGATSDGTLTVAWQASSPFRATARRFAISPCGTAPEPDGSCRLATPGGAGKSSVQIKDQADNAKDSFKWKWSTGVATSIFDFDSPTSNVATYHLCIYDGSGASQPLVDANIPNGGVVPLCGSKACWSANATGYKYKNKSGTPGGITAVTLKEGISGKAQVQVKGKGVLLDPPATNSLVTDVVVQLLIDDGVTVECFKTSFPGLSGEGGVTKQDATQFKAKGP